MPDRNPTACVGNFLAQAQPAWANCYKVSAGVNFLPILTDFFSAGSASVGNLLAQAQPA
jgi:hypothetical protein